jgi:hypothetical protein
MTRVGDVTDCRGCVGVTPPQKACPAVFKGNCKLYTLARRDIVGYCGSDVLWATVDGKAHDFWVRTGGGCTVYKVEPDDGLHWVLIV